MTGPPFRPGQFVWCRFPYRERPLDPGPVEHIGYVADIRRIGDDAYLTVMSIYTTTAAWEPGVPLPLGVIPVDPALARTMKQRGFVMDARRIAFMPLTTAFFPRLAEPSKDVVHTASARFHRLVQSTLAELAKRPDLVVSLGPHTRRSPRPRGAPRRRRPK